MKEGINIYVRLSGYSNQTIGEVRLQAWDRHERIKRGLKTLGTFWGLALVAILIPGLHFVLVPTLLIAGPFAAWRTSQQHSIILGGQGTCPDCSAPFQIAQASAHWPLTDLCSQCSRTIKIEPISANSTVETDSKTEAQGK